MTAAAAAAGEGNKVDRPDDWLVSVQSLWLALSNRIGSDVTSAPDETTTTTTSAENIGGSLSLSPLQTAGSKVMITHEGVMMEER